MSFELLDINLNIIRALQEIGIKIPTDIQEKSIPLVKQGKDVIGISKTGSGKTVAFGVPLLEKIKPKQGIQVLIVAPTRELAVQISKELSKFGKYTHCSIATIFGGVSLDPQIVSLSKADIVVGTPGRLVDHLQRGNLRLSKLTSLVLDEADKMVEMGFIEDILKILNASPQNRQILLFGATLSDEINQIKEKYMHEPFIARTETQVKQEFLEQYYYNIPPHEKFSLLVHLLKKESVDRVIIFCSARSTVELVAKNLRLHGIKVEMLHGKLTQNKRLRLIENFHRGLSTVLVASAVAARGLDIKDVTHVFNYDLSKDPQEYIHRIGRTARAGESGKAITLLSPKDHDTFSYILSRYQLSVPVLPREDFPRLRFDARDIQTRSNFRTNRFGVNRGYGPRNRFQTSRFERSNRSPRFGKMN